LPPPHDSLSSYIDCPYCGRMLHETIYRRGLSPLFFCVRDGWFWFGKDGSVEHTERNPRIFPKSEQQGR